MKITRSHLRRIILKEARYIFEGDGEPALSGEGKDKYGDVMAIVYKILHYDPDTGKGPRMLGVNGYQLEEFSPGRYDDTDGVCVLYGLNNEREGAHVIEILENDGRLDKYDISMSTQTGPRGTTVYIHFN